MERYRTNFLKEFQTMCEDGVLLNNEESKKSFIKACEIRLEDIKRLEKEIYDLRKFIIESGRK